MMTLFYRACGKYRLEHRLRLEARDAQLPMLLALAGIPSPAAIPRRQRCGGMVRGPAAHPPRCAQRWQGAGRPLPHSHRARTVRRRLGLSAAQSPGPARQRQCRAGPQRRARRAPVAPRPARAPAHRAARRSDFHASCRTAPARRRWRKCWRCLARTVPASEVRLPLSAPCVTRLVLHSNPARQRRLGWSTFLPGQARPGARRRSALSA